MCPSFSAAMKAGKPVYTDAQPSLADGLAVPKVSLQLNIKTWLVRLIYAKSYYPGHVCYNYAESL